MLETSPYTAETISDRAENVSCKPARTLRDFVVKRMARLPEPEAPQPTVPRSSVMRRGQAALMGSDVGLLARGL